MLELEPYLHFDGTCEEALNFYKGIFGGEITSLERYAGSPMESQIPDFYRNKVMHAKFNAGTTRFMASDGMPGQPAPAYSGFSMSVNIPKDAARGKQVFDALSAGGKVTMPFSKQFWGASFGMATDKFGVPWMVNCDE